MSNPQLALLLDYESLVGTFQTGDDELGRVSTNDLLVMLEKKFGPVVFRKAIADWSNPHLRKNTLDLQRYNVEMQHISRAAHGAKYIVADQMSHLIDDCMLLYPAINTYVLALGEGDYLPVVCRMKANGKTVVALTGEGSSLPGALQKYCDEIIAVGERQNCGKERTERPRKVAGNDIPEKVERPPIVEAIRKLIGVNGLIIEELYQKLIEAIPDFNLAEYGYDDFEEFLRSQSEYLKFSNTEEGLLVIPSGGMQNTCPFSQEELKSFNLSDYMQATRWYIIDGNIRDRVLHNIYALLEENGRVMTNDELRSTVDPEHIVEDRPWYGTIFSLVYGACLWESPDSKEMALPKHRLSLFRTVRSEDEFLVRYYISLFHKAYNERPELTPRACAELMHPDDVDAHIELYEQVLNILSQRH